MFSLHFNKNPIERFGREGARLLVVALRGGDSTHYYDIPEYLVFLPTVA